ncbi:Peroxyureidoacrylate/ureidoacrylate amidohydrolase RutB [Flavobacterium bizetiae]|uniref:Peroxyureidoacrylate/ureidoacrylate amidohydrolase RutB n=2 Tax=Flavobacterium bizetiae TaxID=2704140 RepID=A0A6J4GFN4_9FLAO|nr:Peroxyureidoacrylate/ureidoacrylate amidohydrolase RutB [Flavobacterium bizetiae]CAD5340286.1 Peroxyureidoacrylate/ureidoacrylate amidohydrolase RutB [Flavobacterium bizetiae]CAD5346240.1 Peroxyureidoacrylate/ureidoacrylate amidohydrolase RutB [Flavobacterium bizetiae]
MKKLASLLLIIATTIACNKKNDSTIQNTKEMENSKKEKTALIIIDIQNDYFPGGTMELVEPEKAALKAKEVLSYFRENKMPVIHVQHIALQEGATFFLPNTKGAEINSIVAPLANEKVITKNYPNSFRDTKLLEYLHENNITNLVFAGMMTDVCIDATVRASTDNGFNNTLISDAVATRDRELNGKVVPASQINTAFLAGLNALGGLYATVLSSDEFLAKNK